MKNPLEDEKTQKVLISEVGPRDGLQNCKGVMPTEMKKKLDKGPL